MPTPTEIPVLDGLFTPVQSTSVFNPNLSYFDPGAVIVSEGVWHMFPNADTGLTQAVNHAASADGLDWEMVDDSDILPNEDTEYASFAVLATSGVLQDDGTWAVYYYGWKDVTDFANLGNYKTVIARATALGPDGPWTPDPAPALQPGPVGSWDAHQVKHPTVIKTEDGYLMYYTGITRAGDEAIGMATSPDGITWTKYDNPATTDAPYTESDPVLAAVEGASWEDNKVFQPSVQITPDGYVMVYKGDGSTQEADALGLALSAQPGLWENGQVIWFTNLQYVDGTYYLFVELSKSARGSKTSVYLATHEGSLK
jgi:hypothetical protein